jgi:hypothetical protein
VKSTNIGTRFDPYTQCYLWYSVPSALPLGNSINVDCMMFFNSIGFNHMYLLITLTRQSHKGLPSRFYISRCRKYISRRFERRSGMIRKFRHKPRQFIVEYYLHWTTMFEISFSGSSETQTTTAYCRILPTLDHHV